MDGWPSWFTPFHSYSTVNTFAQYTGRHFHDYAMTRAQLAWISITARRHGALNPRALVRDPLTMDEYLSAPMVSSPLCLLDLDRYTDGSTVLIVSAGDAVDEVTCAPVRIAAMASRSDGASWDQTRWPAAYQTGPHLWRNTDYTPVDVDVAQLYDGVSFLACQWLEALGFCERGGSGEFIDGGRNNALDGILPLNTGGGQIAGGRLHGFGFVHEAVVQLRGEGGERQVPGDPTVAVCTAGGGPYATALLLAND